MAIPCPLQVYAQHDARAPFDENTPISADLNGMINIAADLKNLLEYMPPTPALTVRRDERLGVFGSERSTSPSFKVMRLFMTVPR